MLGTMASQAKLTNRLCRVRLPVREVLARVTEVQVRGIVIDFIHSCEIFAHFCIVVSDGIDFGMRAYMSCIVSRKGFSIRLGGLWVA